MKIVSLYSRGTGQVGKAIHFTVRGNCVRVGYWDSFPIRRPIKFRSSENLTTKGWQLDVLFFAIAVKYAEAN